MSISRRNLLVSSLFGAGYIGLRALATGVPAAILMKGRRALADGTLDACADASKAQYVIFSTSGLGDPINANCPGTYDDPNIYHCPDPTMTPVAMALGGMQTKAAAPWATLPQAVLDRTAFWHIMTNTPVHPKEPDVLKLQGASQASEMLPSMLAKQLAPCLSTVQTQPITVGATTPSEGLSFDGAALPIIPPVALAATLTAPSGPLANLQQLRDQTLGKLDELYRSGATPAQKKYLDSLVASQHQVRSISQDLLGMLSNIQDNSVDSQITAAIALIRMNVTPVVAIHIPFGGDNHHDAGLANEAVETNSGVASIASLMSQLASNGLVDKVSFMTLNVFGRTLGQAQSSAGRQHNNNHQVSVTIGKPWKAGVIGAVAPVGGDFGATDLDSASGKGRNGADIAAVDTLASFGKTALAAVGVASSTVEQLIPAGKIVQGALA